MNKPKIIVLKDNENSYYPIENHILLNSYNSSILYHEYRHYLQAKLIGPKIFANVLKNTLDYAVILQLCLAISTIFYFSIYENFIFLQNLVNKEVLYLHLQIISIVAFLMYLPTFIIEVDANIFSILRQMKKKKRNQIDDCVRSLLTYTIPVVFNIFYLCLYILF